MTISPSSPCYFVAVDEWNNALFEAIKAVERLNFTRTTRTQVIERIKELQIKTYKEGWS